MANRMQQDKVLYKGNWHFAISKEFVFDSSLSRDARFLYIVLLSFTNDKRKEAFPTREFLCNILKCSDKSLTKYLRELEIAKMIIRNKERSEDGKFIHNVYEIIEYRPKPPHVKFPVGKNTDITNGTCTSKVNVPTNIKQYLNNNISVAQLLITNFNPENKEEVTKLAKLINKYKGLLGEDEVRQILYYLLSKVLGKEKSNFSIASLGSYLGGCLKNKNQDQTIELELV